MKNFENESTFWNYPMLIVCVTCLSVRSRKVVDLWNGPNGFYVHEKFFPWKPMPVVAAFSIKFLKHGCSGIQSKTTVWVLGFFISEST